MTLEHDQEELEAYYKQVKKEAWEEVKREDPFSERCQYVEFVSRSAGRGRKRKPRLVALLKVEGKAFVVEGENVHHHKSIGYNSRLDVSAQHLLSDLPPEERTVDMLLRRARQNQIRSRTSAYRR